MIDNTSLALLILANLAFMMTMADFPLLRMPILGLLAGVAYAWRNNGRPVTPPPNWEDILEQFGRASSCSTSDSSNTSGSASHPRSVLRRLKIEMPSVFRYGAAIAADVTDVIDQAIGPHMPTQSTETLAPAVADVVIDAAGGYDVATAIQPLPALIVSVFPRVDPPKLYDGFTSIKTTSLPHHTIQFHAAI